MGIQGELGISTYPASHDTSMAAFNSKTPTLQDTCLLAADSHQIGEGL